MTLYSHVREPVAISGTTDIPLMIFPNKLDVYFSSDSSLNLDGLGNINIKIQFKESDDCMTRARSESTPFTLDGLETNYDLLRNAGESCWFAFESPDPASFVIRFEIVTKTYQFFFSLIPHPGCYYFHQVRDHGNILLGPGHRVHWAPPVR